MSRDAEHSAALAALLPGAVALHCFDDRDTRRVMLVKCLNRVLVRTKPPAHLAALHDAAAAAASTGHPLALYALKNHLAETAFELFARRYNHARYFLERK